jgi:hypothetical protein
VPSLANEGWRKSDRSCSPTTSSSAPRSSRFRSLGVCSIFNIADFHFKDLTCNAQFNFCFSS